MTTLTDGVRVEVAFTTTPDDPAPAYEDISSYVDLSTSGISITRYRQDEFSTVQPGTCSIALKNDDGRFTADNTASTYYPNIKLRKKVRVSYRDQAVDGNLLAAEDASFEGGTVGSWTVGGATVPAIANDAAHVLSGTKAMKITWATSGSITQLVSLAVTGLTIGRSYTFSLSAYVPAASATVPGLLITGGIGFGPLITVRDAFQRISQTFTAAQSSYSLQIVNRGAATAGDLAWIDAIQFDEGALRTFTTTAPAISYRFTGYADEWPTEWPNGATGASSAVLVAVDRLKRLGSLNPMRSVIEQEYLSDSPYAYFTLGEPAASTLVGDTSKNGRNTLAIGQIGTGGTLTFGTATGPATDSLTAMQLVPVDVNNGKFLGGDLGTTSNGLASGQTLEAFFLSSTATNATIAALVNVTGPTVLRLSLTSAGKLQADTFGGVTLTSAATVTNGATHHAAVTHSLSGGTVTMVLYLDGVSVGSTTFSAGLLTTYNTLNIGGSGGLGVMNGTLSHVACYDSALSAGRIADHYTAGSTGFSGERSDQRIARYARWVGIPTAEQTLDTGLSTSIAFVDTTDQSPVDAMRDVESTESGILAVNGAGQLLFQSRSHRYNATSALSLTGDDVDTSARFVSNDAYLINDVTASRSGGITFRATNTASITDYGSARTDVTLLTTSDNEVIDAANWKANQTSTPSSRLPSLTVDLVTSPSLAPTVLARDISDRITVSSLPTQAPASSIDLFVEGWTENITLTGWPITFNTSPATGSSVWQLDSALYSQLDISTRLAY